MKTTRGIYYDLEETEYIVDIDSRIGNIKLYFSSPYFMNIFKSEYENYIIYHTNKLKDRYKININSNKDDLYLNLLISLYVQREKRGFKVTLNGKELSKNNFVG